MKKYDIQVEWMLNYHCNFNCDYCFFTLKFRNRPEHRQFAPAQKVIDFFNSQNKTLLIHLSGGEPFLYPNFIDLCQKLTEKLHIAIDSNLTLNNVYDFANKINPERVNFISASLHIDERDRIGGRDEFIKKINYLQDRGFKVYATQVMHPIVLEDFEKIFDYFNDRGGVVLPKSFNGKYEKQIYPQSYSEDEKNKILYYIDQANQNPSVSLKDDKDFLTGNLSFKGSPCSAGRKLIVIDYDGTIRRCFDGREILGNIFQNKLHLLTQDQICTSPICHCAYHGLKFASGQPKVIYKNNFSYLRNLKRAGHLIVNKILSYIKK